MLFQAYLNTLLKSQLQIGSAMDKQTKNFKNCCFRHSGVTLVCSKHSFVFKTIGFIFVLYDFFICRYFCTMYIHSLIDTVSKE